MKNQMIIIFILVLLISGCTAINESPVLYVTLNLTDNESGISLADGRIDMELVSPLKVPRQDQNANTAQHISMLGYLNQRTVTYLATEEYTGEGTYILTAPTIGEIPKYGDSMAFEARIFNETSGIGIVYFYSRWRWNETE